MDAPRAVSAAYSGSFSESASRALVEDLRAKLGGNPSVALVFASSSYAPYLTDLCEVLTIYGRAPLLVAVTGQGFLAEGAEFEAEEGFSVLFLRHPEMRAIPIALSPEEVETEDDPLAWHRVTGVGPKDAAGWLLFANPHVLPVERLLRIWNRAYPAIPVWGGLAGGASEGETAVFLDRKPVEGGVAIALQGRIGFHVVVSQGCRPIGDPYTVTGADRNILYTLGSGSAYQALATAFESLSEREREKAHGQIFIGLAVSEYRDEFQQGDFLVRNILGADPSSGAVAVGALVRVGQTLQYQLRDPNSAEQSLRKLLLDNKIEFFYDREPLAALVSLCAGRGKGLFGVAGRDAGLIQELFPRLPAAGFFANGEIGPVGKLNYLHGYSASVLFLS
ncbi:FIST N-terminal domain-containing protein [Verrucomicrobium sp. 3C]|uniref:FIST signal transduction protein n=1 Tax=Verrucomicrobium sp. 3C TaxID=1134055 RepID=UPI00038102AD|nr:FIST N-terminal domain-containing protein [Verrucomicrobium sp. 3C]